MIVYKIKKPGKVVQFIDHLLGRENTQRETARPPHIELYPKARRVGLIGKMNKMSYDRWLDANVRGKFKVGDLVCMAQLLVIPNVIPAMYSRIEFIKELWFDTEWDNTVGEPACILTRNANDIVLSKCPSTLRLLTPEETKLVNLSDTQIQGSA